MWLGLAILSFVGGLVITAVGARATDQARPHAALLPPAKIADGRPFPEAPKRSSGLGTAILGVVVMIGGPLVCLVGYVIGSVHWGR